jgi:NAD(P)-dependent dehydrogenase (short-subunit alcohol dehydrogenase family)
MRTWVITGASTGIGRGIAEAVLANFTAEELTAAGADDSASPFAAR